jgi:thiol-disulfide isomerase/thioredoxin
MFKNRSMKRFLLIIFLSILVTGCRHKNEEFIIVDLNKKVGEYIAFQSSYVRTSFSFLHESYNKYYKLQLLEYTNIPKADNFFLVTINRDFDKFLYELNKLNLIDQSKFLNLSNRIKLDTTAQSKKMLLSQSVAVTGYIDNKQFVILDSNDNKDFSDEKLLFFNEEIDYSDFSHKSSIPNLNLTCNYFVNGKLQTHDRIVKVFPNSNFFAFQRIKDTTAKKLGVIEEFQDYWVGELSVEKIKYDIVIQGPHNNYASILIKKCKQNFSKNDKSYNWNFSYKVKDTLRLSNKVFVIDSLNSSMSKLFFKQLSTKLKFVNKGNRIGEFIDNYELSDLNGNTFSIFEGQVNEWVLLDFWGTWCGPCKELTPELKKINNEFSDKLKIIGIAYDKSPEIVKRYVTDNKLTWGQGYLSYDSENDILKDMKIEAFPTFILFNRKRQIIYRGSGIYALNKIKDTLRK